MTTGGAGTSPERGERGTGKIARTTPSKGRDYKILHTGKILPILSTTNQTKKFIAKILNKVNLLNLN